MYSPELPQFVLASSSSYRAQLLHKLLNTFECASPNIDESIAPTETAKQAATRLSQQKAQALRAKYPKAIIIGSDQVAVLNNVNTDNPTLLGKPHTVAKAKQQLSLCSGNLVSFYTGLCVSYPQHDDLMCEQYDVYFRDLSADQIDAYITREMPLDCAGSFKSEGLGICLFKAMSGRDPNSLVGLPLMALQDSLLANSISLLNHYTN